MALANVIYGDMQVTGGFSAGSMSISAGAVTDSSVASGAAISTAKMNHRFKASLQQAAPAATTALVTTINGATGTIRSFKCNAVTKHSSGSTTIDLKKNGTTVLSSTVVLDSGNTNYIAEAGTLSVTSLVAGDALTIVVTVSSPVGATFLNYEVEWDETAV